ncbi:MAG TPA: DUF6526 family protein [Gemmatimonadaceae bacterium]|nr:DUF6526 family protein [Gemmatimonadaceae bacterium]
MSAESPQSLANHARYVTGYHRVTALFVLLFVGWSMWHAATTKTLDAHFQMLGAFGLVGTFWYARSFPLKAQDRVIRLEEQLRLTRLLPDELRARVDELTPRQLIALRFVSDAEAPELVRWVLANPAATGKEIKQRIRAWRPDTLRV